MKFEVTGAMRKIYSFVLALALVSIITVAGTATASAKGKHKEPIDITATMFVTALTPPVTNDRSGWSTIESETLAGGLIIVNAGPAILQTTVIKAEQSSREQFTSFDLLNPLDIRAIKGKSKGNFFLTSYLGGDPLVVGKYDLKVSNTPECQIYGKGHWKSKAKNSIVDGHGDITVCTNFDPFSLFGPTFVTTVNITGAAALID